MSFTPSSKMTSEEILKYSTMLKNTDWVVGLRLHRDYLTQPRLRELFQQFLEKCPTIEFVEQHWNKEDSTIVTVLFCRDRGDDDLPCNHVETTDQHAADYFESFAKDGHPLLHCGGEPIGSPSTPLYAEYKD